MKIKNNRLIINENGIDEACEQIQKIVQDKLDSLGHGNVIANVDFNIFFLDELLSNMDADSRYIMLTVLKDTLAENRTIFVVNHAEMPDDFFNHKIRVSLQTKKIVDAKKKEEVIVKTSKYEKIF